MIELRDISLFYTLSRKGSAFALKDVNAFFERGSFSAIIGSSGCGKTSLIKIIAALISPSKGSVFIEGNELKCIRGKTSVIFQDYGLLPWKTVMANAELPLLINKSSGGKKEGRKRVESLLEEFDLADFAKRYPHELSGGMKQRLAIVRALAGDPDLLLMDEPFSSLDAISREDAQDFLLAMQRERKLTVIMVTHSIEEAVYLADSVYVMNGTNPGTVTGHIKIDGKSLLPSSASSFREFRGEESFQKHCVVLRSALQKPVLKSDGVVS